MIERLPEPTVFENQQEKSFLNQFLRALRNIFDDLERRLLLLETTTAYIHSGTGSPEGVLTAAIGSIYSRTDGGAGTTLYVKESGVGNTGWVAK